MFKGAREADTRLCLAEAPQAYQFFKERTKQTMLKILQKAIFHSLFLLSLVVFIWMVLGFVLTILGI